MLAGLDTIAHVTRASTSADLYRADTVLQQRELSGGA
jgi:hypothetical protein